MTRFILLFCCISTSLLLSAQGEFIIKWNIESDGELLTIPIQDGYTYNFQVDWGDGSIPTDHNGVAKYTYPQAGEYEVKIIGDFPSIYLNNEGDKDKLLEVVQWGNIKWESFRNAFYGAKNMQVTGPAHNESGAPDLALVTDFTNTFRGCSSMGYFFGIRLWDMSKVKLMEGTFQDATISVPALLWDVSSVTSMKNMFNGAINFNDTSVSSITDSGTPSWDVSKVTDMSGMFKDARSFSKLHLNQWDVSNVTTMANMFSGATAFNGAIGDWNVKKVTSMIGIFGEAETFNKDLNKWDVSSVTNMFAMFKGAKSFNKSLKDWDVSNVTSMGFMFCDAEDYNQDISRWDVSNIAFMTDFIKDSGMSPNFYDKALFEWSSLQLKTGVSLGAGDITYCRSAREFIENTYSWNFTDGGKACYDKDALVLIFETIVPNQQVSVRSDSFTAYSVDWDSDGNIDSVGTHIVLHNFANPGRHAVSIYGGFNAPWMRSSALKEIAQWGTSVFSNLAASFRNNDFLQLTALDAPLISEFSPSLSSMFSNCPILNADINHWDVSNVTDMSFMFSNAISFNHDLNDWDVSNVTDMSGMFKFARAFNGDVSSWDVCNVTDMSEMFSVAQNFNQDISEWEVGAVTNMSTMLSEAYEFNQDIGGWDVDAVTDMSAMFRTCLAFDQDLNTWVVKEVVDMSNMFLDCRSFNHSISNWNVRKVTTFSGMFLRATSFNHHFNGWLTLAATDMSSMFSGATSFNQRIDGLFTIKVKNMNSMFRDATSYNQPMNSFKTDSVEMMASMFTGASSFDQDLENWDITRVTDMTFMLSNSGMSRENYDNTLIGWVSNGQSLQHDVAFGAAGLIYCDGLTARNALSFLGWDITGDSLDCSTTGSCNSPITNIFNGNIGPKWNNAGNWSEERVPDGCDHVVIGNDKTVLITEDAICYILQIEAGGAIDVNSDELTVTAMLPSGN